MEVRATPIGVVVIDDQAMFAEILARLLDDEDDIEVLGVAASGAEGIELTRRVRPDVVLVDYQMPGQDGIAATEAIKRQAPDMAVVMLTASNDEEVLLAAIDAGCAGLLTKDRAALDVAQAVRAAAAGETMLALLDSDRPQPAVDPVGRVDQPAEGDPRSVHERLRSMIVETPLPVLVHVDGLIVAVSGPAMQVLEATNEDDLLGRQVFELISPDSMVAARDRQLAIRTGGWPLPEVLDVTTLTGTRLTLEITSVPVLWNEHLASQVTLRPVQDRWGEVVRIGAELTASIAHAAIITDIDLNIAAWNDEAAALYGWSYEEVVGRTITDIVPLADTESAAGAFSELRKRGRWEGVIRQVRRDGSVVTVDAVTQVIHDQEGTAIGAVSVNVPSTRVPEPSAALDRDLLDDLEGAISGGQLRVAYQPIVNAAGRVREVEALVRWQHPVRGLLAPAAFIPAAESSSLMGSITAEVLRIACVQVVSWRRHSTPHLELSVNVSGRDLADPRLVDGVSAALSSSGLPPTALWLEITETALALDVDLASIGVGRLRDLGVRIALDDFGTGFSTLAQLHRFGAHALKIDRMFVEGISDDVGDAAIVRAVLALGRELGLTVVAEGVETAEQREVLLRLGCELFQGYLFAAPSWADPPPGWLQAGFPNTKTGPVDPSL
jgi:PAS domain S-box-containing protein